MKKHEYQDLPEWNESPPEIAPMPKEESRCAEENGSGEEYYEFSEDRRAWEEGDRPDRPRQTKKRSNIGSAGLKMLSAVLASSTVLATASALSDGTFLPDLGVAALSVVQTIENPATEPRDSLSFQELAALWRDASQDETGVENGVPDVPESSGGPGTPDESVPAPHVHSYRWEISAPAGCVTPGTETGVCACGATETRELPVVGHSAVEDDPVVADCVTPGKTAGSHCAVCGEILTAPVEIPALGHTVETLPAIEPTCTEPGQSAGSRCSVCGEILEGLEAIPATGHSFTYTQKDETGHTKTCGICGHEETENHTFDENGNCTLCGYTPPDTTPSISIKPVLSVSRNGATVTVTGQIEKKNIAESVTAAVTDITSETQLWTGEPVVSCTDTSFTIVLTSTADPVPNGETKLTLTLTAGAHQFSYTLTITLTSGTNPAPETP